MKYRVEPLAVERLSKLDHQPRTEGVHLSQVIQYILRKLEPARYGKDWADLSDEERLRIECGYLWEDLVFSPIMLDRIFPRDSDTVIRNLELDEDSIYQTLDGFHVRRNRVIEVKYSGSNVADPNDPKFKHWRWQNMAYCRTARTTRAVFIVLFHVGRGIRPFLPEAQLWWVRYTPAELEKNWHMIQVNRDEMLAARG